MALTDCIYCAGRSGDPKMTDEHIWPKALGGAGAPEIFLTHQVCQKCNNGMGQWVDGMFIKSWFGSMDRALSAHSYLNPEQPEAAPIVYWGFNEQMPLAEGYVCERWTGLAQEPIFHVHQTDQDRWLPFAGGDIIRRHRDPGRVYFFLTSSDRYWVRTALLSIAARFPRARLRCLTRIEGVSGLPPFIRAEAPIETAEEAAEIAWIRDHGASDRPTRMHADVTFTDRFQAKLALGLAHTILGPEATFSPYGDALRARLWNNDADSDQEPVLRGTSWWNANQSPAFRQFHQWPDGWTVVTNGWPEGFGIVVSTPTGGSFSMLLSDDPNTWRPDVDPVLQSGAAFVFVPQRGVAVGPIHLLQYVSHLRGIRSHPALAKVDALRVPLDRLPPKRVPGLEARGA